MKKLILAAGAAIVGLIAIAIAATKEFDRDSSVDELRQWPGQ